jgi:uncharacterized protein with GYD domain
MRGQNAPRLKTRRIVKCTMPTFIMLTKLAHGSLRSVADLEKLENRDMDRIRTECKDITWQGNFAVLGPYDYVDIFEAPDIDIAMKVSTIVRTFGHAKMEVWPAKTWHDYKDMIRGLAAGERGSRWSPAQRVSGA